MTSRRPRGRQYTLAACGAAVVALGSIGCSAEQGSSSPAPTPSTRATTPAVELSGHGTLAVPGRASNAFTYNSALAPPGARLAVTTTASQEVTRIQLAVSGLVPNRGYAVHLHAKPCGATGDAAGPHFQHYVDPAATPEEPSSNPEYANPRNEVWLDIRTNATGSGTSSTEVPFVFTDRAPASLVVHEAMVTATGPGEAGQAGERVACLALPKN